VLRPLEGSDFDAVVAVVEEWWGGRPARNLVQRLFFDHFTDTSLAAEVDGKLVGFLIGFVSSRPGEAYVHVVGVDPEQRGAGLGRELYERFFELVRARGCTVVRAITAPVNTGSIAFHRGLGFELEASDREVDGVPVHRGHDVNGGDRVLFVKHLD